MNVYSRSDIGMVRKSNQDDVNFKLLSDNMAWAVVCDGMGGANGGDIASKEAVSCITEVLSEQLNENITQESIEKIFESSVKKANSSIYEMSQSKKELSGMGTTVVLALIYNDFLHIAHVGDSRAYIVNKDGIKQVTLDHSVVQELINNGEITHEEAEVHPRKNIITRALGISSNVDVDYSNIKINKEERVLLCTDGLTNYINPETICDVVNKSDLVCVADELVDMANNQGGSDNITVALIAQ